MGTGSGVRERAGQSGVAAADRVSGCRESNPQSTFARSAAADQQRASTLAEIGKRLGRKGLEKVAAVARPDTILGWFRKLIAQKFDGSKYRSYPGRPATSPELIGLIVRLAR